MNIIKQPAKAFLSDNPVVFGFRTSNHLSSAGSFARLVLHIDAVDYSGNGHGFTLSFLGTSFRFTCATVPDSSGLQYQRPLAYDTTQTWLEKIATALRGNYYISSYYSVSVTAYELTLTAKTKGSRLNVVFSDCTVPAMIGTSYTATDETQRPFFKIYAQAQLDGVKIGDDLMPVDSNGNAYFDFSEYLRGRVNASCVFPETQSNRLLLHSEAVKPFSVRYGEYYGDAGATPQVKRLYDTTNFFALPGGVSSMTQALYNEYGTNWYQQQQMRRSFMTWRPTKIKAAKDEIQKLWFFLQAPVSQMRLFVGMRMVVGDDPDIVIQTVCKATLQSKINNLYEICCGHNILQLDYDMSLMPANYKLLSYDIFLRDQDDNIISEIRNFEIDNRARLHPRTFLFKNSFGLWETFTATGILSKEASVEFSQVNRLRTWRFRKSTPDLRKADPAETITMQVNSGWLSKEECDWMREIQLSTEVYEVKSGVLWPVVFTGSKIKVHTDDEYLYSVDLEYIYAFTEEHYSIPGQITKLQLPIVIINNIQRPHNNNPGTTVTASGVDVTKPSWQDPTLPIGDHKY